MIAQFIFDIGKNTVVQSSDTTSSYFDQAHVQISFQTNGEYFAKFDNLSFGYDVVRVPTNKVVYSVKEPNGDYKYIETDQEIVFAEQVSNLIPEEEYSVNAWAENNGKKMSTTFTFTTQETGVREKFPSWIRDEETHIYSPPIPYPAEGHWLERNIFTTLDNRKYIWDEKNIQWEEIFE